MIQKKRERNEWIFIFSCTHSKAVCSGWWVNAAWVIGSSMRKGEKQNENIYLNVWIVMCVLYNGNSIDE